MRDKFLLFGIALLYSAFAFPMETDNFTDREKPLREASEVINETANRYLEEVISAYNKDKPKVCDKTKLLELLRLKLNTNYPEIFDELDKDKRLDKIEHKSKWVRPTPYPTFPDSVYRNMWLNACCAPMVVVNGHHLGLDKIDHIFSHGLPYYQIVQTTGKLDTALALGTKQEEGCWGLACIGVKSYGDMAANYQGYLLWSNMTDGSNPYIKCVGNEFRIARKIDIREYVDDSLDEAINCSSFDKTERANTVLTNVTSLGYERCPIKPSACNELQRKYPESVAKRILHPACLNPDNKKINFVEKVGSEEGLDWVDTIKMGTNGVKIKNLLKGVGIQ